MVYIEGRLHVEEWTDRDGKPRYTLEVHATDMQFLGGRGAEETGGRGAEETGGRGAEEPLAAKAAAADAPAERPQITDDDIPF
jgi:single-strand DNA-binding protein